MSTKSDRMGPADTITRAFARQVAERPLAVALTCGSEGLTYADLDRRSDLLAQHLRDLGTTTEDVVAICLPRSVNLVVSLLGVLKAGAAYLALDLQQPDERRDRILRDADVGVVITPDLLDRISDRAAAASVAAATYNDSTAYVAYTSGSTGNPRGVCVPHRAVLRLVSHQQFLPFRPDDVFLHLAPVAFDASTLEIWGPLLNGGRLVIAPPGETTTRELTDLVRDEGVTTLWLTAGLFHAVVDAGPERLRGLRHLVAGGDVLSADHVERARHALPDTRLVNGYGPTENTTFTTCHVITGSVAGGSVPIGLPINGTTVHILDHKLLPVPEGAIGELYTGGVGMAHGYRNSPVSTAARFVPDSLGAIPGGRLYRTGDLARRRSDGVLEYFGRNDKQVKIRGFRVETSEVEAALRRHPEVQDAAVVAQGDGDRSLAAFYVSELPITSAELRKHCARIVPGYMLPAVFHCIRDLPLTANGKVDRVRLAATSRPVRPELSTDLRRPNTEMQVWLVALWTDLLQVAEVGIDDDFFELGGHSLLAGRIIAEVSNRFGRDLPPVVFYENPTIAELADLLGENR